MKSRALWIAAVLAVCVPLFAADGPKKEPASEQQPTIDVVSTAVSQISTESTRIAITIAVTSDKSGTVENISFGNLKLNDVPLYASPYTEKFTLKEGQATELPHAIEVTTYFRDLDSTKPLQEAIQSGRVTVSGDALLTVHLNAAAKMLLFEKRATVPVTFKKEVPISIPGGMFARLAAVKVLQGADAAARTLTPAVAKWVPGAEFRRQVTQQYLGDVMFALAVYTVTAKDGHKVSMEWDGVAVLTAPDKVILPKEALEPWSFDPDVVVEAGSKNIKIDTRTLDVWLWAPNTVRTKDNALKLSNHDFKVAASGGDDSIKIHRSETKRVELHRRDADGNAAILSLAKPIANYTPVKFSTADGPAWDTAAVVRYRNQQDTAPDIVVLSAKRDGDRILLGTPIDSHAYGSPVITTDGIIGMVQDERSALPWPTVTKTVTRTAENEKKK